MANHELYVVQGKTLDNIAGTMRAVLGVDKDAPIRFDEVASSDKTEQINTEVEAQADLIAQIKKTLEGKASVSAAEIIALIDQSGVLDSTDGTATEKVEQLIDKAEDENVWYEASKYISFQNQQSPFWNNRVAEKTIPRINFAENITTSYLYSFAGTVIEYIDYYMDTKKGVEFGSCFAATKNLKWIKGINISNATSIGDMFNGSSIERIIEPLDLTNVTYKNKWNYAPNLSDFRIVPESYKLSGGFPYSVYTSETIQSIIDGLATVTTAQTLTLHKDVKAKLTEEQLATITSKNWNLA